MRYHFRVWDLSDDLFRFQCVEFFGCAGRVVGPNEIVVAAKDALDKYLSAVPIYELVPEPVNAPIEAVKARYQFDADEIIKVLLDPGAALALRLRRLRANRLLFQEDVAEALGMKNLFQYRRLEQPRLSNPTLQTLAKLKRVFPELNVAELSD